MKHVHFRFFLKSLLCFTFLTTSIFSASATTLQRLGLDDMTARADKIFRGVVIDVEQSSMWLGGAQLPVVLYRLQVAEQLKGSADVVKGDSSYVEIKMLGSIKAQLPRNDGLVRFDLLRDIPRLNMGADYVLFTTHRSQVGLSTMVGLGQGAFNVVSADKQDWVMNQYGNANINGAAMTYESFKQAVSAALAN